MIHVMQDMYIWYMDNLERDTEMGPRTVGAALRQEPILAEPSTPEKKNARTRSATGNYGVDGLYYFDTKYARPAYLAKRAIVRTFTHLFTSPRVAETQETLQYWLPRLVRYR